MPSSQQDAYLPSFLDFVNRPNPVEPSTISRGHEPSSSEHLHIRPNGDLRRILEQPRSTANNASTGAQKGSTSHSMSVSVNPVATVLNHEPDTAPADRALAGMLRDADQFHLTLPRPNKQDTQAHQPQVPPVLQGLHQPPPNAGILPSMNASKARSPQQTIADPRIQLQAQSASVEAGQRDAPPQIVIRLSSDAIPRPARRNKWTDAETHALLQGTRRFGVGNWKKILTCADYSFNHRTATDLKDRFRVVSSNKEMLMQYAIYDSWKKNPPDLTAAGHQASNETPNIPLDSDGRPDLELPRAKRRQRTKWSTEEDDALLRGFGRYGPSWTSIQLDPVLKRRTPTDIRDRIRTRFSDAYTKAGLTPKPAKPRTQMRSRPREEQEAPPPLPGVEALFGTQQAAQAQNDMTG